MRHVRALTWILLLAMVVVLPGCPLPGVTPTTAAKPQQTQYAGQVLDLDGKPAANVLVHGYLVSNNAGALVSNNSASYRTQATQLEVRTDASGHFALDSDASALNIEAVLSDNVKAISLNVPRAAAGLQLQLAYTGSISGRVTAPGTGVSNFEGVDVFVPGTSYLAKADSAGNYVLSNMAPGTFSLVASKTGLGRANVPGIRVKSKETTQAADLALSLTTPAITGVAPANAAPGETVTLTGDNFGATTGEPLVVSFNSTIATSVQRVDDHKLTVTVPAGATTGNIVLTVGGVVSNAQPFSVIKTLALNPGNLILAVGQSQALAPSAVDTAGAAVASPSVRWSSAGAAITLQGGTVSAAAPGEGTVTITTGNLTSTRTIRVVSQYPTVSTIAGSSAGFADGQGAAARFELPYGLAIRPNGNLLVADQDNHRIREVTPAGLVSTFAGTGTQGDADGTRTTAEFNSPECIALDSDGTIYVTEYFSRIRQISPSGDVTTFAGTGTDGYQNGPAADAMFNSPYGIVVAPDHTVFVTDTYNHCIRQISQGVVSTLAGNGSAGLADGQGSAARFYQPRGLTLDGQGNLIVTDSGNHAIRKVTRDGTVTTLAGGTKAGYYDGNGSEALFDKPVAAAVDANGLIYVADLNNHVIRLVTPQGVVSTYAGTGAGSFGDGPAKTAQFGLPSGVAFDANGRLFVVDDRIRQIQP